MSSELKYEPRSEEVQEVLNQIPSGIQRYGLSILFCIIVGILIGCNFFSYPDKVEATFSLSSHDQPVYITSPSVATIKDLYVYDGQEVQAGHLLGVISEQHSEQLLQAPIAGIVSFIQTWKINQRLSTGETMMVITPKGITKPIGKVLLPMQGRAHVEIGQRAIIRMVGFEQQRYGFLEGLVAFISPIPDANGMFALEIELPNGLTTTSGEELPFIPSLSGTAEIITKERNLLNRLLKGDHKH